MKKYFPKFITALGFLTASYILPVSIPAQQNPVTESNLERNIESEEYSKYNLEINVGESLRDFTAFKTKNIEKLEWLVDVYNHPLREGDKITIIEKKFSDSIYYPYSISVDYSNPR